MVSIAGDDLETTTGDSNVETITVDDDVEEVQTISDDDTKVEADEAMTVDDVPDPVDDVQTTTGDSKIVPITVDDLQTSNGDSNEVQTANDETKVDMSLADIIQKNKSKLKKTGAKITKGGDATKGDGGVQKAKNKRKKSKGAKGQNMKQGNLANTANKINQGTTVPAGPAKIVITNLLYEVNDTDIKELFGEIGPFKQAGVHYDSSGKSLGTAHVMFKRGVDAVTATTRYNGVKLDGRPMNIYVESSGGQVANTVLQPKIQQKMGGQTGGVKRLQQARGPVGGGNKGGRRRRRGNKGGNQQQNNQTQNGGRGRQQQKGGNQQQNNQTQNGGRGRQQQKGGRAGKGKGKQQEKKIPTAAQLDKQLDAYMSKIK